MIEGLKQKYLKSLGFLLFVNFSLSLLGKDKQRPNILFLFADDQRADTIAAHGNPHIQTPHLDSLAEEGFSFLRNYCAGSFSGAVCVASRAMLMTGQHWMTLPREKPQANWGNNQTLPVLLKKYGNYICARVLGPYPPPGVGRSHPSGGRAKGFPTECIVSLWSGLGSHCGAVLFLPGPPNAASWDTPLGIRASGAAMLSLSE